MDANYANLVGMMVSSLRPHVSWAATTNSISALSRIARVPNFEFAQFVNKVRAHPYMLKQCPTVETYAKMYEECYNRKSRAPLNLAFLAEEIMRKRADVGASRRRAA